MSPDQAAGECGLGCWPGLGNNQLVLEHCIMWRGGFRCFMRFNGYEYAFNAHIQGMRTDNEGGGSV